MKPLWLKRAKRQRHLRRAGYQGPYADWAQARAAATGYDAAVIFERVRAATGQVRDGAAVYERDSVIFDHIEHAWPLATALLRTAAVRGRLSVLDFGGSLGSSYFQNRGLLSGPFEWSVVEQAHFVRCGQAEFSNAQLRFYDSVTAVLAERKPNLVLLSSVLQYLEDPVPIAAQLAACGAELIIIDRMPLTLDEPALIYVQHVPPEIYPASYPLRVLRREQLLELFPGYQLRAEFASTCDPQQPFLHRGYALAKTDELL